MEAVRVWVIRDYVELALSQLRQALGSKYKNLVDFFNKLFPLLLGSSAAPTRGGYHIPPFMWLLYRGLRESEPKPAQPSSPFSGRFFGVDQTRSSLS